MSAERRDLIAKQSAHTARQNVAGLPRLTTLFLISDKVHSNSGRSIACDNLFGALNFMSVSTASFSNSPARTPRSGVFAWGVSA
jgi:hypothetical protein